MGKLHSLADGPKDWGAVFSLTGESEDGIPRAPKRAGSSSFDYWWKDCGHAVSIRDPEALSQLSTPWTKDLARWTREAERANWRNILVLRLAVAALTLEELSQRLAETPAGKLALKRRKVAEMNARYVRRAGKKKYVGKKVVDARKAKRAAAARARRALVRMQSHAVNSVSDAQLTQ
jgi:hypothetical protein